MGFSYNHDATANCFDDTFRSEWTASGGARGQRADSFGPTARGSGLLVG